ncbi:MAG: DNA recombination protein RmuC [Limimaricola cinnabarinus]|jgi:DNA recombination protein RmuC|uniref:DNA recombination protein RmuC homolog n=1 Tax=Limimaricola cinnabarinus LL-001 TaxID=1337093 RepID=U2YYG6_9RHOB|nr:DNA recombination protein RmuC [Limimaricola cinnabarinus]GAD54115.1 DNA recombination protein RmuC [Limimaricola cinnabarinus LL-001]
MPTDPLMLVSLGAALVLLLALVAALTGLRAARAALAALRADLDAGRREVEDLRGSAGAERTRLEERERQLSALKEELTAARKAQFESDAAHGETRSAKAALEEARRGLEQTRNDLKGQLLSLTAEMRELQERHAQLQSDHATLQARSAGEIEAAETRISELKELREEMSRRFEELATKTLRQTGEDFSKANTRTLTELLTPFRDHVSRFETELRQVHGKADEERARLGKQIEMLTVQSETIRSEAAALTRALKGDKQKQGAWGEMILERILESSGLERGTHYTVQESRTDEDGARWRPDVVVRMPRGKSLVVDSKVSLIAYEAAVNAETEDERKRHLREHVASVRRHIDQLAAKGYYAMQDGSVDYVLMFMPIEGALSAALSETGDLTAYAVSKGVGVMTPTTLMVTLRTVDHIWTVERRESNAEDIAKRAGLLYDKVAGFVGNMEQVGRALGQASRAHEDAMGQLSSGRGNVLGQIEKLKSMGARTQKNLGVEFDEAGDDAPEPLSLDAREPAE